MINIDKNTIEEIKKIILLKLNKDIDDNILSIAIYESIDSIKDYCNIEEVPFALKFTVVNISIDIISSQYIKDESLSNSEQHIKSIQEGDTTITFQDNKTETFVDKNSILNQYTKELNRHRKLRR